MIGTLWHFINLHHFKIHIIVYNFIVPTYKELMKIYKKNGVTFKRQAKGSHEIWIKDDMVFVVPKHIRKEIPKGTWYKITKGLEK